MTEEQKKKCEEIINNHFSALDERKWFEYTIHFLQSLSKVFNKNMTEEEATKFILDWMKNSTATSEKTLGGKRVYSFTKPNFHFYNGNLNDNSPNNFLGWLICNYFDNDNNKENKNNE